MSDTPFADALRILEEHYYTPVELAQWLTSPLDQFGGRFGGRLPIQVLAEGEAALILEAVQQMDEGVYL